MYKKCLLIYVYSNLFSIIDVIKEHQNDKNSINNNNIHYHYNRTQEISCNLISLSFQV